MSGLASQRRSKKLAASVIDIGVLYGLGYVNRIEGAEIYANLRRQGYLPISEKDFHEMFTEAVAASKADSGPLTQISTGLNRWDPRSRAPLPWHDDARFCHHRVSDGAESTGQIGDGADDSIKGLLEGFKDKESIATSLRKAFSARLETMLQLPPASLDAKVAIIDLGVDSLAAVEIRSWFLKEIGKDMPVLKILGGSSVDTRKLSGGVPLCLEYGTSRGSSTNRYDQFVTRWLMSCSWRGKPVRVWTTWAPPIQAPRALWTRHWTNVTF